MRSLSVKDVKAKTLFISRALPKLQFMAKKTATKSTPAVAMKSSLALSTHRFYSGDNGNMYTPREGFYEVNRSAYLFPSQLKKIKTAINARSQSGNGVPMN